MTCDWPTEIVNMTNGLQNRSTWVHICDDLKRSMQLNKKPIKYLRLHSYTQSFGGSILGSAAPNNYKQPILENNIFDGVHKSMITLCVKLQLTHRVRL